MKTCKGNCGEGGHSRERGREREGRRERLWRPRNKSRGGEGKEAPAE